MSIVRVPRVAGVQAERLTNSGGGTAPSSVTPPLETRSDVVATTGFVHQVTEAALEEFREIFTARATENGLNVTSGEFEHLRAQQATLDSGTGGSVFASTLQSTTVEGQLVSTTTLTVTNGAVVAAQFQITGAVPGRVLSATNALGQVAWQSLPPGLYEVTTQQGLQGAGTPDNPLRVDVAYLNDHLGFVRSTALTAGQNFAVTGTATKTLDVVAEPVFDDVDTATANAGALQVSGATANHVLTAVAAAGRSEWQPLPERLLGVTTDATLTGLGTTTTPLQVDVPAVKARVGFLRPADVLTVGDLTRVTGSGNQVQLRLTNTLLPTQITAGDYITITVNESNQLVVSAHIPAGRLIPENTTETSIQVRYKYANGTDVTLFRGTTVLQTFTGRTGDAIYTDAGLEPNTTYHYYLRNGTQPTSLLLATVSLTTVPATATGTLTQQEVTHTSVTLAYSYSYGSNVSLFRGTTLLQTFTERHGSGTYTDSGLTPGTTYTYQLRNGTSSTAPLLASLTVTTPVYVPTGALLVQSVGNNQLVLSYSYQHGTNVSLFLGNTLLVTFSEANRSGTYTATGLQAWTPYTVFLRNGSSLSAPLLDVLDARTAVSSSLGALALSNVGTVSATVGYAYSGLGSSVKFYLELPAPGGTITIPVADLPANSGSGSVQLGVFQPGTSHNLLLVDGTTVYGRYTVTTAARTGNGMDNSWWDAGFRYNLEWVQSTATSLQVRLTAQSGGLRYPVYQNNQWYYYYPLYYLVLKQVTDNETNTGSVVNSAYVASNATVDVTHTFTNLTAGRIYRVSLVVYTNTSSSYSSPMGWGGWVHELPFFITCATPLSTPPTLTNALARLWCAGATPTAVTVAYEIGVAAAELYHGTSTHRGSKILDVTTPGQVQVHTLQGLQPDTFFNFVLMAGTEVLAELTCQTLPPLSGEYTYNPGPTDPQGSLQVLGITATVVMFRVVYQNTTNPALFRGSQYVQGFDSGNNDTTVAVTGLSPSTSYTFYLRNDGLNNGTVLHRITVTTAAA